MKLNKFIFKDYNHRKNFYKLELLLKVLKIIYKTKEIKPKPINLKHKFFRLNFNNNNFNRKNLNVFNVLSPGQKLYFQDVFSILSLDYTRIRNRCLYTGRGNGILPEFKMSRMQFRRLADIGKIPGIRRASW